MKRRLSKVLLCSVLITSFALCFGGCSGVVFVDKITFRSAQSESKITLNVTGYVLQHGVEDFGKAQWYSSRSKDNMLAELKKNDLSISTVCGYDFVTFEGIEGIYNLRVREVNDTTYLTVDDMYGQFLYPGWHNAYYAVFPYFMMTGESSIGYLEDGQLLFDYEYTCDANEMLTLAKELGIWYIEEQSDGFILSYKGQGVRVIAGEGTVTLQEAHPIRPSVLTYDSRWGEEKVLEEIEASGAKVAVIGDEKFVAIPQKNSYSHFYRLQVTPQMKGDYNYCVMLDPMYTTLLKEGATVCELPFPYTLLREDGEPCGASLAFGKAYACDTDLLVLLKDMRAWGVEEQSDRFILTYKGQDIRVIIGDGTVTLQQVE